MVPMRDGVKLGTNIYLPDGQGPWPVVLERTPYNKDVLGGSAGVWTGRGYALVIQDVRGKFKSEGAYRPFQDDASDGYDTVEWAARQPWSDGKVGMFGASAMGITANLAATAVPPHLVAIFTMVARSSIYNQSAFMGGVFRKELNEGWLKREHAESMIAETLKHNVKDQFFDSNEMDLHWSDIQVPAYNYGGWYDIFLQGNVNDFVGLQSRGGGPAAGNQKLMMGPWGHGNLEEVKYPANSAINANDEAIRWFDYWLKGNNNGIMNEPPIKYYVMGDVTDPAAPGNQWRTALSWPPPSRTTSYFLLSSGGLSRNLPDSSESKDTYRYDPADPVQTIGGGNLFLKKGPMDQRATRDRKDVLRYQTPVLDEPLEVTGRVTVELWAESDAPDTDWMVKLVDVYPDGAERLVLDSAARARFRDGSDHEAFLEKGHVYRFRIDLWSTSLIFNKGHHIEVQVSSSNYPRFEKNLNNGKPYGVESEARVATNSIHHDRAHPSRILLPVAPAPDGKQP
jgi:predicted acyl esterase